MQVPRSYWTVLIAICSFLNLSLAQQYGGDNITNTLPAVSGAELAYFKIKDASNKTATLINYYSLNSNGGRINPSNVKRAVVIIHGLLRDPYLYIANVMQALAVIPDSTVNKNNVAMIAPYFANGDDKGVGYPWTAGLKAGRGSTSNALVWQGSQWASGADNQYPAYPVNVTDISSYDVLDQIIQYFDNPVLFPNMQQIVIAGHSLGGQTVQRYAVVGDVLKTKTPVSYWSGNPDSLAWLATDRNYDISSCSTYDDWRQGLSNYGNRYGASLVAQGRTAALARYNSRRFTYAHGTKDFGDDSTGCGPNTTGINRSERLFNFLNAFPVSCANPSAGGSCATVDYVVAGHDAGAMMSSPAGQARLFLDNFNGNGTIAYDFGYPRAQKGDDPYPNPALAAASPDWTKQVYQSKLTYQGCWTKGNTSSLAYRAYQGNSSNTIEGCTSTCLGLGYSTTGMAWGYDCYCDSAIGYDAIKTADGSCSMTCSGNSNQFCGGEEVFAVWSTGNLTQNKQPIAPTTVNNYTLVGCMTDGALTGKSTSGVVSLESCATYCAASGYTYFGTEYRNECHCGNSISNSSVVASSTDCNLACTGNSSEICGGSLRLSVYNTTIPTTPSSNLTCTNNASNGTTYSAANGGSYQILCSFDSFGGDISGAASPNIASCIDTCDKTSGCIGVGYTGGMCWLKSSLSSYYTNTNVVSAKKVVATSPSTTPTCIDGAGNGTVVTASNGGSYQVLCSMDSWAGDISGAASSSLSDCVDTCDKTSGCIDVSYTGGNCWLKSSITGFYTNTAVISAQKVTSSTSTSSQLSCVNNASSNTTFTASNGGQYLIRCQTDRYGGDISGVQTSSLADCVNACDANSACLDVSYVTGYSPNCWLKSSLSASYSNANVATAEKITA